MTVDASIVSGGSTIIALLLGWRLRPRLTVRAGVARPRPRRWMWLAPAVLVVVSPILGLIMVTSAALWCKWFRIRRATRAARQIAADFPDALDLLVLSIRAGYLPAQAVVEIAPFLPQQLQPAFAAVSDAMRHGDRFADALGALQAHLGPIAQALVDSLSAADRYGLPLAPVLERLAFDARQQRRRDADAAARELPVRLAMPLVLCTLPSFVLLAIVPLLLGALSSLHT